MDIALSNAEHVLGMKRPEWLFTGSEDENKQLHRDLAKLWHPDVNKAPEAERVFQHVSHLWEEAEKKKRDGFWGFSGILLCHEKGKKGGWNLKYHAKRSFELGMTYIGDHAVIHVVEPEYEELFKNGALTMSTLTYPSKKVEEECRRYLPSQTERMETEEGKFAVAVRSKTPDMLCLRDVMNHYGGDLHPTQAAWILSTLFNLSCYLAVTKLTHNDISPDTYFISPEKHSGALLGGWWYAQPKGGTIKQLPKRTVDHLPWKVKASKKASRLTDQELIRLTGREMLGDKFDEAPDTLKEYLTGIANEGAIQNYKKWIGEVLPKAFGARRFVKMDLNAEQLYR